MFTKQHYEALAKLIWTWCSETYDEGPLVEMDRFVQALCETFEKDRDAFDANKFRVATSLYDWADVLWDAFPAVAPPKRVVVPTWMNDDCQMDWLEKTYGAEVVTFHVYCPPTPEPNATGRPPPDISYDDLQAAYAHLDVVPSFFDTVSHEMPDDPTWWVTDNRESVAVYGRVQFRQPCDPFWGEGKDYQSDVVVDPTWDKVMHLAHDMVKTVGDHHHVFVETVNVIEVTEEGVKVVQFGMGS